MAQANGRFQTRIFGKRMILFFAAAFHVPIRHHVARTVISNGLLDSILFIIVTQFWHTFWFRAGTLETGR
jgi:hypothetical protein